MILEIKNSFTIDEIAVINNESKKKFKIISIICLIIGIISIVPLFIVVMNNDSYIWSLLLGLSAFLIIFFSLLLFNTRPAGFKRRLLKINPSIKDGVEYNYLFDTDEFTVVEKLTTTESNNKIKYSALNKVIIGKNYIYLYLNQFQAFPIKKSNINDLDLEELKRLLANKIK